LVVALSVGAGLSAGGGGFAVADSGVAATHMLKAASNNLGAMSFLLLDTPQSPTGFRF
jgi:hypothetical protein